MPSSSRSELKLNTRALPLVVALLIALQLIVPYHGWMMLLVGLGGAWLIAYFWARALARGLRLTRELRFGWAQVGDHLEERFTLSNASWLPALWVEIADHSTLPGHAASLATGVDGGSDNSWIIKSVCARRGAFTLGPTTLCTSDPFSIYTVTLENSATTNMMVMPPIVPLPRIEIAPGGRAGEGARRADSFERAISAKGVRQYAPGDHLNAIHWRASAHHDSLLVRLFDSTPASDWWILLDLNQRAQIGVGQNSTMEHAIILAASLADRGLRAGRAVGLVTFTDNLIWLPPQSGETRRWEILRALALVSPGTRPLVELLAQMQASFKQRTSLIVITPDARPNPLAPFPPREGGWGDRSNWIAQLIPLRWRGIVPTILLLDPLSFGGKTDPRGALAALADLEIARHVITREVLDRPEAQPGLRGHRDWQVTPLGRVLPRRVSRDAAWRTLDSLTVRQ
ncbi:MAG: DUF58 domain-containing protein [Chloroflexi bacterium]|nr:DUF58 domain-containing protein [Chloroflexota bacterium]